MVDKAIEKLLIERPNYEVFTISILTDPDSAISSIHFDNKNNSDYNVKKSNERNKKYYDYHIAEGELEQAKMFEQKVIRNSNPANFDLKDYCEIINSSIPKNWEVKTKGRCWYILEPALKEIGVYTFIRIGKLNTHSDFELSVNGRHDWYEFTWKKH